MPRITTNAPFQLNVTYKKVGNHCIFQFQGKEERLKTTIYIYIYILDYHRCYYYCYYFIQDHQQRSS